MIVGLLWADQNLKDVGDLSRILTSQERNACFNILNRVPIEELNQYPYFSKLDLHQAALDNVVITESH